MTADEFNKRHPIGTDVIVNGLQTETTSIAWTMPSGKHMVNVNHIPGGVELSKVKVIAMRGEDDAVIEDLVTKAVMKCADKIFDGLNGRSGIDMDTFDEDLQDDIKHEMGIIIFEFLKESELIHPSKFWRQS